MKPHVFSMVLAGAVALTSAGVACAAAAKADAPAAAASKPVPEWKSATPAKQVDINSASAKELKTLPGIGEAEAAKIIAGRPYGSKAQLVTHNILSNELYEGIKRQVVAKQPYKDGAKNAALYEHKK